MSYRGKVAQHRALSDAAYLMLAHLSSRPMAAPELVQRLHKGTRFAALGHAESFLYAEVRRLAERGLATAHHDRLNGRRRTVYTITPAGSEVVAAWVRTPTVEAFRLHWPALAKLTFGYHNTKAGVLAQLRALRMAHRVGGYERRAIEGWRKGNFEFPERAHFTVLLTDLYARVHTAIDEWLAEAEAAVSSWPSVRDTLASHEALRVWTEETLDNLNLEPRQANTTQQHGSHGTAKTTRSTGN